MCNIREVVLQEYDLQMYKGNNLERGMYLGMVCFRHTVVYIFEDAGILILVSFCTIQKKPNSDTVPFSLKMPFV